MNTLLRTQASINSNRQLLEDHIVDLKFMVHDGIQNAKDAALVNICVRLCVDEALIREIEKIRMEQSC